jgi:hypothetical protein
MVGVRRLTEIQWAADAIASVGLWPLGVAFTCMSLVPDAPGVHLFGYLLLVAIGDVSHAIRWRQLHNLFGDPLITELQKKPGTVVEVDKAFHLLYTLTGLGTAAARIIVAVVAPMAWTRMSLICIVLAVVFALAELVAECCWLTLILRGWEAKYLCLMTGVYFVLDGPDETTCALARHRFRVDAAPSKKTQ